MSLFTDDEIRGWYAEYHPCRIGLHIFDPDEGKHGGLTIENFPFQSSESARSVFAECRNECEACIGEPEDYIVDLCTPEGIEDGFFISGQMLSRLKSVISATTNARSPT